jgi:hypothetical protein
MVSMYFVCLSVSRFQDHGGICYRLIESDDIYCVLSSKISLVLSLIAFAPFSPLARSNIECYDSFGFTDSVFVENTVLKPQSISCLIVDYISIG